MNVLDIFYNEVIKEAKEGKVEAYFTYNILFNTLQYFTFYIIILIVLALYSYATHSKVKIEQSKYPNTKKRWAMPTVFWII